MIWNVLLESLAIAMQLRAKIPYGAGQNNIEDKSKMNTFHKGQNVIILLPGISMRKMSRSPMRTVSTSPPFGSKMRIRGGGAAGAEVMLIMSGSLLGRK